MVLLKILLHMTIKQKSYGASLSSFSSSLFYHVIIINMSAVYTPAVMHRIVVAADHFSPTARRDGTPGRGHRAW